MDSVSSCLIRRAGCSVSATLAEIEPESSSAALTTSMSPRPRARLARVPQPALANPLGAELLEGELVEAAATLTP